MSLWRNFETKNYHGMTEIKTGKIVAYENSPRLRRRVIETTISNPVNPFPCTDEDFVILAARKVMS